MRIAIILFACGICWLQYQPHLPGQETVYLILTVATCLAVAAMALRERWPRASTATLSACAVLAGIGWAALIAQQRLSDALPDEWQGRDITLVGTVAQLPQRVEDGVRFVFETERVETDGAAVPSRIQLSWYEKNGSDRAALKLPGRSGERWRLTVRLKRPHSQLNPGGYDFEAWLLERNLRATGYVRAQAENVLLGERNGPLIAVHRLRGKIRDRILNGLTNAPYAGVLVALAVGDQHAITAEQWRIFRATGITHLVAISGLHVSFVALVCGGLLGIIWRRIPALALRWPTRRAMAVAALCGTLVYAFLAGWGIPVQRAAIMLAVVTLALMSGREAMQSSTLLVALFAVLLFDPWAVLSAGFWLSFGAVAVILFMLSGRYSRPEHSWSKAVRLQLGITLALVPLLLLLFQSYSLVSPLANAIAIPVVSLIVAPLALLSLFLPTDLLLWVAHGAFSVMMIPIQWLAEWPSALQRHPAPPLPLAIASAAAAVVLLLPRATPGKAAALSILVALLGWQPTRPRPGEFSLTVLDVGNALSVHIRTATHDILYDAGPAYRNGSDAGDRVVLPYLYAEGVNALDLMLISHNDLDHAGGADSVAAGMRIGETRGFNAPGENPEQPCHAGMRWQWDDVRFEILHPLPETAAERKNNNDSCVLKIRSPYGSALLTGDIERAAETLLTRNAAETLASDIVVVPHHGSRSSSTARFVKAVHPRYALFSTGYRNPFGHPHPAVWARWEESGAINLRTDMEGAIRIDVGPAGISTGTWRQKQARYWHQR